MQRISGIRGIPVFVRLPLLVAILSLVGCSEAAPEDTVLTLHGDAVDPDTAPRAAVDRFGEARATDPSLPGPNVPIDFDADHFRRGLGPDGQPASYYDFGPATGFTMPAYRLVDEDGSPIEGQLLIIGELPGATGYSDFWQITEVEVPPGYVPNSITSVAELMDAGYPQTLTVEAFNLPVVPDGSSARFGAENGRLFPAWIENEIALSFAFTEAEISVRGDLVAYLPIYVCLTTEGAFCTDAMGGTHNVLAAVPPSPDYSPLWRPMVYPESAFDDVRDLDTALATDPEQLPMLVNCPATEW